MNNLDGQIFFTVICAVILAWLGGLIIARRYNSKLLSFMQTGESPEDESAQTKSETLLQQGLSRQPLSSLSSQNTKAIWRYRMAIVCISVMLSLVITLFYIQDATPNEPFSFTRTSLLLLAYGWPVIPCLGLLERWSRLRIIGLSLVYTSVVVILVLLNSGESASLAGVMMWLYGQQIPPLVFIFVLTGPKIRTLGPYLLMVFFLLIGSSLIGYQALDQSLAENNLNSWVIDLAELSNAYFVFALFGVLPWLIVFFPLRYFAKSLANLYRDKFFSEPLYLLSGIWLIIIIFQAMALSHGLGMSAYTLLISWLIIPIVFFMMRPLLKPRHHPPTLLLLRVFREDDGVGKLFDNVLERWRYSGNTVMIAAKDLALRTLEPDQLFGFLNGHLQDRFIRDNSHLQQEIARLDLDFDPDGRFRVNEFFCFDSTWKMVLNALISKTGLVLMDLRAYHSKREGCSYELDILANSPHLQKIIILFDAQTDTNIANHLLGERASEAIWIEDDKTKDKNLEKKILTALLK